jgi:hypothetical protein
MMRTMMRMMVMMLMMLMMMMLMMLTMRMDVRGSVHWWAISMWADENENENERVTVTAWSTCWMSMVNGNETAVRNENENENEPETETENSASALPNVSVPQRWWMRMMWVLSTCTAVVAKFDASDVPGRGEVGNRDDGPGGDVVVDDDRVLQGHQSLTALCSMHWTDIN